MNLKRYIPIAVVALCMFMSCNKGGQNVPLHDTTYVWGIENWSAVQPLDEKVPSSADSASVRYVFLLNDGVSLDGLSTSWVLRNMNMIIERVAPENRHKIRGAGTLNEVGILGLECVQDSITLAQMGFTFGNVRYGSFRDW